MTLAVIMGIPSLVGVAISQVILLAASDQVIRLVFLAILLYTIVRLLAELRTPSEKAREAGPDLKEEIRGPLGSHLGD